MGTTAVAQWQQWRYMHHTWASTTAQEACEKICKCAVARKTLLRDGLLLQLRVFNAGSNAANNHLVVAGSVVEVALPGAVCRGAVAAVAVRRGVQAACRPWDRCSIATVNIVNGLGHTCVIIGCALSTANPKDSCLCCYIVLM
jgi:hypothetical protein